MRAGVAITLFLFATAQAGEFLRFKVGKVKADQISTESLDPSLWTRFKEFFGQAVPLSEKYFVAQYANSITARDLKFLKAQGVQIINYVPDDALLIKVKDSLHLGMVRKISQLRSVVPYLAEWKLSPDLALIPKQKWISLVVRLLTAEELQGYKDFLRSNKIPYQTLSERTLYLRVPSAQVLAVSTRDEVEWSEPWTRFENMVMQGQPTPPLELSKLTGLESGSRLIGAEAAWKQGLHGEGQVIGVADTGFDTGDLTKLHPDLSAIFKGIGFARADHSWADESGHGTHVAGSIVGNGKLSEAKVIGSAPSAKLMVQAVMNEEGLLAVPAPSTILNQALAVGVRIHSNSWGSSKTSYNNVAALFDDYIWKHPELLVLFAAGNSGGDYDQDGVIDENSVGAPGTAKNVLTVGASENQVLAGGLQVPMGEYSGDRWGVPPLSTDKFSDHPSGIAGFSGRGPTDDGRRKPDVVAPGTNILSTRAQISGAPEMWGVVDDHYVFSGGTSMATPVAAGAAGLIRQYLVSKLNIPEPSAALLKAVIMHTAEDLFPGQYGLGKSQEITTPRPNFTEGFGRIDVARALNSEVQVFDEKMGVGTGESKNFIIKIDGEKPASLTVTLNYTDAPGLVSGTQALVNDLDLSVTAPDGKTVGVQDRLNNNEYLELPITRSGLYKVTVIGVKVIKAPLQKQSFALVVSEGFASVKDK